MRDVFIIGAHTTQFKKWPEKDYKTLTREAYEDVLADAGLEDGERIGLAWFGNCGMWAHSQGSVRGQVCFTPLVREGRFPERVPMINVEGACATAAMTLNGACTDVRAGDTEVSLAIAVEKLYDPDSPEATKAIFDAAIDRLRPGRMGGVLPRSR
jgi:acetyl-CoA acetyltransferase